MKPAIAQPVIYTRATGEEFTAHITRVILTRTLPFVIEFLRGPHAIISADQPPEASVDETDYDVYLAILVHDADEATLTFTASAVPYDASDPPAANTWRWPPPLEA